MDIFPVFLKLYLLGRKEWVPPQLPFTLADFCHGPCVKKKKKKDEEGQGERRQVTVTLGWTVGTLRKQKLGRQNVRDQEAMFTEKGQVWMQEPKRKVAMEAQEEP